MHLRQLQLVQALNWCVAWAAADGRDLCVLLYIHGALLMGSGGRILCVCAAPAQEIGTGRAMRFTFLSGDVHVAGHGQFVSSVRGMDLKHDYRYMSQVR